MTSKRATSEISRHEYEDTFSFIRHPDAKIHLDVDEIFRWMDDLHAALEAGAGSTSTTRSSRSCCAPASVAPPTPPPPCAIPPGGRATPTAPSASTRKTRDASAFADGERLLVKSRHGSLEALVRVDDGAQPSVISLPHGFGLGYPDETGARVARGPAINTLTGSSHCDPLTKTPYHKNIPVRLRRTGA